MSVATAVLVMMAVRLRWPSGRSRVRSRLVPAPPVVSRGWLVAVALAVGAVASAWLPAVSGPGVVLVATVGGVGWFAALQVRAGRARATVARHRAEDVELLGLMSAELRAGVLAQRMMGSLADDFPMLRLAARTAETGGDVAQALRAAAEIPGCELLRDVAGAWQVSDGSGAPLATVIGRLEQSARVDREIDREIQSGVAPARATGRMMAALPAMGLLLGSGMGGDPVEVLTSTWIGVTCLAAGCGLACAGIAWIERIATTSGTTS